MDLEERQLPDLKFSEIMAMQKQLQDKHEGKWTPLTPEYGRSCLLWMVEELGEVVSIIKKNDIELIMHDGKIRSELTEEFVDILMFMNDALICYGITANDFCDAYTKKHAKNMSRDYDKTNAEFSEQLRSK